MNRLSKNCNFCIHRRLERKARTLCEECGEYLGKECSDTHLFHRLFMNHTLIDLYPPGEEPKSANEDNLASDFLQHATVSETTVLYRAQVAVESKSHSNEQMKQTQKHEMKSKLKDVEIDELNAMKCLEFSVLRPEDERDMHVNGVLVLGDKVTIIDKDNMKLKLYDRSGRYLSSTDLNTYTWGITQVNTDRFATCGYGKKVILWTLRGDTIVMEDDVYDVDHEMHGIHYNKTYYSVLHKFQHAVTILDRQGRKVRKIVMKEAFGKKIEFGCDIHADSDTHNIYIPCLEDNSGVLCTSVEGEALWFTPLSDGAPYGITEIHGVLCVADYKDNKQCLHLMSKTGQYKGKLLEKEGLDASPMCLHYDELKKKLFISHIWITKKRAIVCVYSIFL